VRREMQFPRRSLGGSYDGVVGFSKGTKQEDDLTAVIIKCL
jgi:serine phosphatase RsbU (regulator of sigma subunit)